MKVILVLFVLLVASPAFANTGAVYPNETAETLLIGTSVGLSLVNVIGLTTVDPSYWLGGIGIGAGIATLGLTTGEHPRYENGLVVTGTVSAAVGLITILQRIVMDKRDSHARLAPSWSNGASGLAFVVDF